MRDLDLEKRVQQKLQSLDIFTRAGVIQIIVRLTDQKILKSYFYRMYAMHPETVQNALKILIESGLVSEELDGRKKLIGLTDKGKIIAKLLENISDEL